MPRKSKKYTNPFLKAKQPLVAQGFLALPNLKSAIELHQQGQLGKAKEIYHQLLVIDPKNADALNLLGVIAHQTGHYQDAINMIDQAIEVNPDFASYYSNRGIALVQMLQYDAAIADYIKAIELKPDYVEAYLNLGNVMQILQQYEAAIANIKKAIFFKPDCVEAYLHNGNVLQVLKQYDAAIASYRRAIELKPNFAEAYYRKALLLHELQQYEAAIANYKKAIFFKPDYVEAYLNLGNVMQILQQYEAAIANYNKAIFFKPDYVEAYLNLGNVMQILQQYEAAIAKYNRAIELKPDYADAYLNRGNVLQDLKQYSAAIANYNKALDLNIYLAEGYSNRGVVFKELKQLDKAVSGFDRAIAIKPNYADAYWNKSLLILLIGDYEEGLKIYEWRWETKDISKFKRNFSQPLWLGDESLSGKTILLHAEQGLGDTIQFCRFVKMVSDLGAKVIFEVQKPLVQLLKDLPGVATLIAKGDPVPEFDYHCPLMSLPLAFKTDLNSVPSANSYLVAEAEKVAYWKNRIKGDELKIGIAWQGSHGAKIDIGRSFELKLFEKIAALPNLQLISLQKGYGSEQLQKMPDEMLVVDLGDELDKDGAFLDSSAVMMNLDLVITSDTALAHLAGALGIKTWVALKYVPDWRWMLDRKDSPWYPSVTLYRQQKIDDWATVFNQMLVEITLMRKAS